MRLIRGFSSLNSSSQSVGYFHRGVSSSSTSSAPAAGKLRVAIVGGGVTGLSSALHLAPLVTQGLLQGPIDVYDGSGKMGNRHENPRGNIGVGLWSTALDPFKQQGSSEALQRAHQEMFSRGKLLSKVGYRTPKGHWLAVSQLGGTVPDLLFLRERDMLGSLREAARLEEKSGALNFVASAVDSRQAMEMTSDQSYHLIVAADGMHSALRESFGGTKPMQQLHDRGYTVFRGVSPYLNSQSKDFDTSFQTWGEGRNMRFASVPLTYTGATESTAESAHVWFATINDTSITSEPDAVQRKERLLETFREWHHPVVPLMELTPPQDILMDRAVAHKERVAPVVVGSRRGSVVVFLGDACMTVDPILAQGCSVGMEGASRLASRLSATLARSQSAAAAKDGGGELDSHTLCSDLLKLHHESAHRYGCLLRASDLVGALGQPSSGTMLGTVSQRILRPIMRMSPNAVKTPIFNSMLKYSLGNQ